MIFKYYRVADNFKKKKNNNTYYIYGIDQWFPIITDPIFCIFTLYTQYTPTSRGTTSYTSARSLDVRSTKLG